MKKVENIKKIIEHLNNPYEIGKKYIYSEVETEFLKYSKLKSVDEFNKVQKKCITSKEKQNSKKYARFDNEKKLGKLKKDFLNEMKKEGFYFCCYCGKNELLFLEKKEHRLYDIEHFLPRDKYPDLSVNLLNWLPVCGSCNSRLKGTKNPLENKKEIFHPFFGFKINSIESKTLDEKYSFCINDKKGREFIYNSNHSDFFHLKDIYESSYSTENEIININFIENKILAEKENSINYGIDFSFKKSLNNNTPPDYPKSEQEILKYSNGKLKKDLIDNLQL